MKCIVCCGKLNIYTYNSNTSGVAIKVLGITLQEEDEKGCTNSTRLATRLTQHTRYMLYIMVVVRTSRTYPTTRLPPWWTAYETSPMRPMPPPPYTRSMPLDTCICKNASTTADRLHSETRTIILFIL